jgi:hypothetical protein
MSSWVLLAASLAALGLTALLLTRHFKPRATRTRVDFRSYKAMELQRRGSYSRYGK